jgi:hypothetical protein
MALLDKLNTGGSVLSNLNGNDASIPQFELSKLHNTYSINGTPDVPKKPTPSQLDLDGQTPSNNYRNNPPEGRSF